MLEKHLLVEILREIRVLAEGPGETGSALTVDDVFAPRRPVAAGRIESAAETYELMAHQALATRPVVVKAPVGDHSRGPVADLAAALKLAAEAGEWAVVAGVARQLEAVRRGS